MALVGNLSAGSARSSTLSLGGPASNRGYNTGQTDLLEGGEGPGLNNFSLGVGNRHSGGTDGPAFPPSEGGYEKGRPCSLRRFRGRTHPTFVTPMYAMGA